MVESDRPKDETEKGRKEEEKKPKVMSGAPMIRHIKSRKGKGHTLSKRSTAWSGLSRLARKAFTSCSLVKPMPMLVILSMLACETPKLDDKPGPLKVGPGPVGILGSVGATVGTDAGDGALDGKAA